MRTPPPESPCCQSGLAAPKTSTARNLGSSPGGGDCESPGGGIQAQTGRAGAGLEDWDGVPNERESESIGSGTERQGAEPRTRKGGVRSPEGQGLMGTGRQRSPVGGRGQGHEGAEYLHEPASRLGAADPHACWGGAEVVQHQVVQSSWPGEARQPGASP